MIKIFLILKQAPAPHCNHLINIVPELQKDSDFFRYEFIVSKKPDYFYRLLKIPANSHNLRH